MQLHTSGQDFSIFLGDARKLDLIPDSSIDLVVTDAPYGINYVTGKKNTSTTAEFGKPLKPLRVATDERFEPISGDERFPRQLLQDTIWELHRVLKQDSALYIFTRWDIYHLLISLFIGEKLSKLFTVKNCLTWVKNNWSSGDLEGNYAYQTELIIFCIKGRHILLGRRDSNLLPFKRVEGQLMLHPAEKPVSLLAYLITKSCPEGGTVLDPFMGSGSTLEAALQVGRKAVGVDIEEKWCKVAAERLQRRHFSFFEQVPVSSSNFSLEFVE